MFKKNKKKIKEVLTVPREDRRMLSNVPDPENIRGAADRRGIKAGQNTEEDKDKDANYFNKMKMLSLRYVADFEVLVIPEDFSKREGLKTTAVDISTTGLLVEMADDTKIIQVGDTVKMHFDIPDATMPEGFESTVKLEAVAVRIFAEQKNGQEKKMIAFEFSKPLTDYFQKKTLGIFCLYGEWLTIHCCRFSYADACRKCNLFQIQ